MGDDGGRRYEASLPLTGDATPLGNSWRQQGIPLEHVLVAASQHGDGEVLRGLPLGVVLANHDPSLDELRHQRSVFFARRPQAWGILEGMDHYRFLSR